MPPIRTPVQFLTRFGRPGWLSLTAMVVSFGLADPMVTPAADRFQPWQLNPTRSYPWDVELGDFNFDGHSDLAVAILGWGPGADIPPGVLVFNGRGDGSFERCDMYSGYGTQCLVAGDFGGDGFDELFVPFGSIGDRFWDAPGCVGNHRDCLDFTPEAPYPMQYMLAARMDGDQFLDIVTASSRAFTVFFNEGAPCFHRQVNYPVENVSFMSLEAVDLTGDGRDEVVVAYRSSDASGFLVYRNDGAGGLSLTLNRSVPSTTIRGSLAAGDLSGDGKPDLVLGNIYPPPFGTWLFLGDGNGGFAPARSLPTGPPAALLIEDVTGDGFADLVMADRNTHVLRIYPGPITTLLGDGIEIPLPGQPYEHLLADDLNNDGRTDLMLAQYGGIGVLLAIDPTPVDLVSVSGVVTGGDPVIRWRVSDGTRPSLFRIHRRFDAEDPIALAERAWNGRLEDQFIDTDPAVDSRAVDYWIEMIQSSGRTSRHGPVHLDLGGVVPVQFLSHPNPFRESTALSYSVRVAGHVRIDICDLQGRPIAVIVDEWQEGGSWVIPWDGNRSDGRPASRGIYFARLRLPDSEPRTLKILLER